MSLHRTLPWLAVWALAVLVAAPAHGQGMQDLQAFAPAEMDHFGEGARANEGVFFQLEGLCWWIQAPQTDAIGQAGMQRVAFLTPSREVLQSNSVDTSGLSGDPVSGTRFEVGYVHGHDGILFSYFNLTGQNERLDYGSSDVVIDDHEVGLTGHRRLDGYVAEYDGTAYLWDGILRPLPVKFDELAITSRVKTWGTELEYVYRSHAGPHGGILELLMGARYLQFDDRFTVEGYGDPFLRLGTPGANDADAAADDAQTDETPIGPGTILADSVWWASAQNHVIGPQIGLRWFRQTERWTWSAEGRFFAGLNTQNLKQGGTLGSELGTQFWTAPVDEGEPGVVLFQPQEMTTTTFVHKATAHEWSPGVELRLDLKYQLTRAVNLRVGWNGFWIDGMARSADLIDYAFYETQLMGIDMKDNRQSVFIQGLTFGVDVNR